MKRIGLIGAERQVLMPEVRVGVPPGRLIDVQSDKVKDVQCCVGAYGHVHLQDAALKFGDVGQEGIEEHVLVRAGDSVTFIRAVMPREGARERAVPDASLDEYNEAWPGVRRDFLVDARPCAAGAVRVEGAARHRTSLAARMPRHQRLSELTRTQCHCPARRFLEPRPEVTLPGRLAIHATRTEGT